MARFRVMKCAIMVLSKKLNKVRQRTQRQRFLHVMPGKHYRFIPLSNCLVGMQDNLLSWLQLAVIYGAGGTVFISFRALFYKKRAFFFERMVKKDGKEERWQTTEV